MGVCNVKVSKVMDNPGFLYLVYSSPPCWKGDFVGIYRNWKDACDAASDAEDMFGVEHYVEALDYHG